MERDETSLPEVTPLGQLGGGSTIEVTPMTLDLSEVDRVTANFQFYYQQQDEDAVQRTCIFSDTSPRASEEPYARRIKVTEEGVDLELGWLKDKPIGVVLIENRAGRNRRVKPSEEEIAEQKKQVIVVTDCGGSPGYKIRPGRFHFAEPVDATKIRLTSLHGVIKALILVCPGSLE